MKDYMLPAMLGAGTGVLATLLVWKFASVAIDQALGYGIMEGEAQLRGTLDTELNQRIPPMVRETLQTTLAEYNITPQMGQRLSRALNALDTVGIL